MERAVSVLATKRPRRYLSAIARIVIAAQQPSCGGPAGLGAIELGHVENPIGCCERRLLVRDEEQRCLLLPTDFEKGRYHFSGRPYIEAGAGFIGEDQWRIV